jgi:hypothetical protein
VCSLFPIARCLYDLVNEIGVDVYALARQYPHVKSSLELQREDALALCKNPETFEQFSILLVQGGNCDCLLPKVLLVNIATAEEYVSPDSLTARMNVSVKHPRKGGDLRGVLSRNFALVEVSLYLLSCTK